MAASKKKNATPAELLQRLESRHEDLLDRIDDLNGQIEAALTEVLGDPEPTAGE